MSVVDKLPNTYHEALLPYKLACKCSWLQNIAYGHYCAKNMERYEAYSKAADNLLLKYKELTK